MASRLAATVAALTIVICPSVQAAPVDRAAAAEAYLDLMDAAQVPAGWTGSVEGCAIGTESVASLDATRTAVNLLRDFAGLQPVAFDPELSRKALAAALMMRAANALSHSPGAGWPCHTPEGAEAAGKSNLFLGLSGAAAMTGYVDDAGVDSLGHRRWLLDPRAAVFGSGSTGTTNALWVIGGGGVPPEPPEVVTWPPAGHVPWPLVFEDWSAAITVAGGADLAGATVAVTIGGQPAQVSGLEVLEDGYGTGRTMKWKVAVTAAQRASEQTVSVTIANVVVGGAPREFTYSFSAFPLAPPLPPAARGARTADAITLDWEAAAERGAPVTGYRLLGTDSGGAAAFDLTVGADSRQAVVSYAQPGRTVHVRVIPLSRAGSPQVDPIVLQPPPATQPPPSKKPPQVLEPPPADRPSTGGRVAARLRVSGMRIRGGRLTFTARITSRANGGRLRVAVRGSGSTSVYRPVIRGGHVRFSGRLSPRHQRARRVTVKVGYGGSAKVRSASAGTWTFRR
jgi:uncharacterized protein YkwD